MNTDPTPAYVIHWRAVDWCVGTVESLLDQHESNTLVTVIDNDGSGGAELLARLQPGVRIITTPTNLGYSGAANVALRDWLQSPEPAAVAVIASHDLSVGQGAIGGLRCSMLSGRDIGVIGPAIAFLASYHDPRVGSTFAPIPSQPGLHDCDWISGTCLMIRRECALEIGEFDERFGSYNEDIDYCLRAKDSGWRVVVDNSVRATSIGSSHPRTARRAALTNSLRLAYKRGGRRALLARWWTMAKRFARNAIGVAMIHRPKATRMASCAAAADRGRALIAALPLFATTRVKAASRRPRADQQT